MNESPMQCVSSVMLRNKLHLLTPALINNGFKKDLKDNTCVKIIIGKQQRLKKYKLRESFPTLFFPFSEFQKNILLVSNSNKRDFNLRIPRCLYHGCSRAYGSGSQCRPN